MMKNLIRILIFCGFVLFFATTATALKNKAPKRSGAMEPESNLTVAYPKEALCEEIASAYGSSTRYDGSKRPEHRFGGKHGGIDLSLPVGTPLLAITDGTLLIKGKGGQMEGYYLWLQHSPDDTGLPYWAYSKYQHLNTLPQVNPGDRIKRGQVIAYSGMTGTTGGHYGASGYPHLHLSTMKAFGEKHKINGSQVMAKNSTLFDPLQMIKDIQTKQQSDGSQKLLQLPYALPGGQFAPANSRVVWPVYCQPQ